MKKSLLLITTVIMLFVSCRKDTETLVPEPISVEQAKIFFEQSVENPQNNKGNTLKAVNDHKTLSKLFGKRHQSKKSL